MSSNNPAPRPTPQQMAEQSDRAEFSLLGALLRDPTGMDDVAARVREEHFRHGSHQLIWRVMASMYQEGRPIELVALAESLKQKGWMDEVGSYPYLADLYANEPTGVQSAHYADLVLNHWLYRQLRVAGYAIATEAENPTAPARELLQDAERRVFALAEVGVAGSTRTLAEVSAEALDRIDLRCQRGRAVSGVPSGVQGLDDLTCGFQPGELILLAARPSVGKTSLGLTFARHATESGAVLFASLEQGRVELGERLLAAGAGVDSQIIRRGEITRDEAAALSDARARLAGLPLHIDDTSRQSVLHIAANARRLRRRSDLVLVVIDYVQLIDVEDRKLPRHEQVAGVSRRLKALARELSVPIVALAQLNREVEGRAGQRPRLSDLRESGSLEADADTVVLLHRNEIQPDDLELIVAKQRNGPTGEAVVRFDRPRMRFETHDVFPS